MKEIKFTVKDALGVHARPAGLLVKMSTQFLSNITMQKDNKAANCKKLFAVMGLNVKCNDNIILQIDGVDEELAAKKLEQYLYENL